MVAVDRAAAPCFAARPAPGPAESTG